MLQGRYTREILFLNRECCSGTDDITGLADRDIEYVLVRGGGKDAQSAVKEGSPSEILARSFMSRASLDYRTFSKIYTPELDGMFFELKARLKRYFDALEEYKIAELARFLKIYKECKISPGGSAGARPPSKRPFREEAVRHKPLKLA